MFEILLDYHLTYDKIKDNIKLYLELLIDQFQSEKDHSIKPIILKCVMQIVIKLDEDSLIE